VFYGHVVLKAATVILLHSIKLLGSVIEVECVYCAVRTKSIKKAPFNLGV
jgi:hypothetical protein